MENGIDIDEPILSQYTKCTEEWFSLRAERALIFRAVRPSGSQPLRKTILFDINKNTSFLSTANIYLR
jgi:hypothetical protein